MRMQAHNAVTPGIGQRTAVQGSYWDPYAQINTVSFWQARIGVRAVWVHVGAHEMHEPVGPPVYEIVTRLQSPRTYESRYVSKQPMQASCVLFVSFLTFVTLSFVPSNVLFVTFVAAEIRRSPCPVHSVCAIGNFLSVGPTAAYRPLCGFPAWSRG